MRFSALVGISLLPRIAPHLPQLEDLPGLGYFVSPRLLLVEDISVWWWVPLAVLVLVVIPMSLASWLSPKEGSYRGYPPYALAAWLLLVATACVAFRWSESDFLGGVLLAIAVMSGVWQEMARKGIPRRQSLIAAARAT